MAKKESAKTGVSRKPKSKHSSRRKTFMFDGKTLEEAKAIMVARRDANMSSAVRYAVQLTAKLGKLVAQGQTLAIFDPETKQYTNISEVPAIDV
jgi:hypothetical protein